MLLPALAAAKRKAQKINCTNNLKQVGLSFRIWEGDNDDKYPQAVSSTAGGASEYVAHGNGTVTPTAPSAYDAGMVFMVMSNELSTPENPVSAPRTISIPPPPPTSPIAM